MAYKGKRRKKPVPPAPPPPLPPDLADMRLLTVPMVAMILHIHYTAVYKLIRQGRLKKVQSQPFARIKISVGELKRFIAENEVTVLPRPEES